MEELEFKQRLAIAVAPEVVKAILPGELKSSSVSYKQIAIDIALMIEKIVEKTEII